ncbi:MAG: ABC transporter substrate-binding protein [Treponema sp.]|nr:ABC transporter substrate-binding protein [Treponema sp.]
MAKKLSKTILAVIIAAALLLIAAIVFAVMKAQPKGMTVAVSTLPDSLNPVLPQNTSGLNANELIFDGLVNYTVDPVSNVCYPELALAESITQDAETKKMYTVVLRDVEWHDGTPLTADDVVYSFNAYTLAENGSPNRDYLMSFIKNVTAEDAHTVIVEFQNPIPDYRAQAVLTFKIIPCTYKGRAMDVNMRTGEHERAFATAPVGTGPFKLTKWEIDKWLIFEANSLYVNGRPQADSLVIKRTIDPIVRMNELRKGRINVVLETNPMDRSTVEKIKNVDINSYMPYAFYEVEINTKLFPSAEGRRAMAMALNKTALVPGITDQMDGVCINNGPFPSNFYQKSMPEYRNTEMDNLLPYDIAQAKILAEKGNVANQNATLMYPDSMGEFGKSLAEGIAQQLAEIGLTVEIRRAGDQVFNRAVFSEKNYELALVYREGFDNIYSSIGDLYRSTSKDNVTGISDKTLDTMFVDWEREVSAPELIAKTDALNERISMLCPALYLCTLQKDVYSRGLKDVAIGSDNPFLSAEYWKFN